MGIGIILVSGKKEGDNDSSSMSEMMRGENDEEDITQGTYSSIQSTGGGMTMTQATINKYTRSGYSYNSQQTIRRIYCIASFSTFLVMLVSLCSTSKQFHLIMKNNSLSIYLDYFSRSSKQRM